MTNHQVLRLIGLLIISASMSHFTLAQKEGQDFDDLTLRGWQLSAQKAAALEQKLKRRPDDLSTRALLLGYYFGKNSRPAVARARQRHILWVIENHPESGIAGMPECQIHKILNEENYNAAKQLWLRQVELYKTNPAVLGNAARFFMLNDPELAESLFKQAESIDPTNSE